MLIGQRRFAPRLWSTLLTLALLALFVSLGRWQLARAEQKRILFAEFAAGADATIALSGASPERLQRYQHVRAAGRFDAGHQVLLDSMTHNEEAGFRVLTPFRLVDGRTVLVDRGWFAFGRNRTDWPSLDIAGDEREIRGRIDELPVPGVRIPGPATEATPTAWPRLMNYPERAEIEAALGLRLYPHIVLLDADQADGFVRDWVPPGFPPIRHIGYAVQWFALALTLAFLYVILNLHKSEPAPPDHAPQ